ncbi:corticotropin-releasing factor receptor 2-like [Watersipora subatra]|uniref:corticotropin-releasing factor receptor 2-like n=1 Tax=Watersipora subatra TaxID=2589382 RepID=UPI00355B6C2A
MLTVLLLIVSASPQNSTCRFGQDNYLPPDIFKAYSCCACYNFMFRVPGGQNVGSAQCNPQTMMIESKSQQMTVQLEPKPSNRDKICSLVGSDSKCEEWLDCCQGSIDCCDHMIEEQKEDNLLTDGFCPSTWDTFRCWKRAEPNTSAHKTCPSFIISNVKNCVDPEIHYVERECLADGKWNANLSENFNESSYLRCVLPLDCLKVWQDARHYLEISCEILSLAFVIPATIIFLSYRNLFKQMRIKIHTNLFIALILFDSIHLIYQLRVRHPDLVTETVQNNSVECRVLNALTKFSVLSMFVWMLVEGFYLHWLMINTFRQPRLRLIIAAGWCAPTLITIVYALAMRLSKDFNFGCWLNGGNLAWIVNTPLIVCLAVNIIFLINILRVIIPKIVHKNEPVYYRKAVKAIAILMAPFGLSLIFTLVSPDSETDYETKLQLDLIAAAVLHSQGFIISIVLCYTNAEVIFHLRKTLGRYITCIEDRTRQDASMMTGVTHLSTGRSSLNAGTDKTLLASTSHTEVNEAVKQRLLNETSNNNAEYPS